MSLRKIILFAVAFILLIIVIWMQIQKPSKVTLQAERVIKVVVAKHDIPPFTVLSDQDVRMEALPASLAANSFGAIQEATGKLTTVEIRAGNVIHRSDVLPLDPSWKEGEMLVFSFYVPTAHVAGGQLRPGHHIDLLVTRGETRDEPAQTLWLARNLWVVGVYQASGEDILRPTRLPRTTPVAQTNQTKNKGFAGFSLSPVTQARQGPANLVVVAARRETAKLIGEYLGALAYDAWVYIRPAAMQESALATSGRIEGTVFEDTNADRIQQRNEPGLDGVDITLLDAQMKKISNVKTVSGGSFSFDKLSPGTYYVEETDPPGYTSVTSNRQKIVLVEGMTQYVSFSDRKITSTPEASSASPGAGSSSQPHTGETPGATTYKCSLWMSDRDQGSKVKSFDEKTREVWVVANLDCPAGTPYSIRSYMAKEGAQEHVLRSGTWEGGKRTLSFKVSPWEGDSFTPGTYITLIKVGKEEVVCAFDWWDVGNAQAVSPSRPEFPTTGGFELTPANEAR
ncbi:MAG: hypothetical protein J7M05_00975 [Anaerolineae bacterium]|nr:hypothetical protein [Anaerolineae bacterium]